MFWKYLGLLLLLTAISRTSPGQKERPYSVLAVEEMLGQVTIFASNAPESRTTVKVGYKPHEITISPDGKIAYVSNFGLSDANNRVGVAGTTISVIDIRKGAVRQTISLPSPLKAPHGVCLRPGHVNDLFSNAEQGDEMVVFNAQSGKVQRTFPILADIHNFVFSSDGAALFAFSAKGFVVRIDPDSGAVQAKYVAGSPVRGLAWTSDQTQLIVSSVDEISLLQPTDLSVSRRFSIPDGNQMFYAAASADGRLILAPSVLSGFVTVLNAQDGEVLRRLHTGTPLRVLVSPDPETAYVSNVGFDTNHLTVIQLRTLDATDIDGIRDSNGLGFSQVLPATLRRVRGVALP